ncbi:MAG: hypothetical protein M1836_008168 [Candelina mexicana]|nr:MAG: hypothetical protein M1836_008168 [Candelina mexicana]
MREDAVAESIRDQRLLGTEWNGVKPVPSQVRKRRNNLPKETSDWPTLTKPDPELRPMPELVDRMTGLLAKVELYCLVISKINDRERKKGGFKFKRSRVSMNAMYEQQCKNILGSTPDIDAVLELMEWPSQEEWRAVSLLRYAAYNILALSRLLQGNTRPNNLQTFPRSERVDELLRLLLEKLRRFRGCEGCEVIANLSSGYKSDQGAGGVTKEHIQKL